MVRWSLAVVFLLAPLLAGCTDFEDEAPQNYVFVQGIDVSAPEVGSGRIVLVVNTTVDNSMAPSGELHLLTKAYDQSTGLLVEQVETPVPPLDDEETRIVSTRLDLVRAPGYRLSVDLYQDDKVVRGSSLDVGNLDSLEPNLYDTGLRIAAMDFEILDSGGARNRSTVRATVYLTNEGREGSRPLSLQLKAREVSTGLLAAQVWAAVGSVSLEATRAYNATLSLPGGYNYAVEAVLWDGDIIVERGVGNVQFAPTTIVDPGQQVVVSRPNLSDFEGGAQAGSEDSGDSNSTPAPGLFALLAVLALAAVLARRSQR
jgi:MYXO-CTERM domain-containing protein